jgi:hypothetical protein
VLLFAFVMLVTPKTCRLSTVGAISQRNLAQEDGILSILIMNASFL